MGNVIDYVSVASLDRRSQHLTEAEADHLEELTAAAGDEEE
ncbi:hypothetical protein HD597_007973 [Nonomuraea thailandensis]|uniref:Uncharacterized protein n=1 Tax=Nonomuraea thailandensis TaxID=1188745 RepID=A0A9X2K5B9_9ACTN|nr:hypothetical protein [Nonomuraea thailandensis]MCP2360953.1 hypothetical protein [Nonomuraea thailandensis]